MQKGYIDVGDEVKEHYWGKDDGHTKLFDQNLRQEADYGNELLAYTAFNEGLCLLYYKNKVVCIDENLNVIFEKKAHIPPCYADASRYDKNSFVRGLNVEGFNDGLAVFTLDGCRYGVLDKDGNVLIEPVFKGSDTLTVMKNQHVAVFYEQEFRIGELNAEMGGGQGE